MLYDIDKKKNLIIQLGLCLNADRLKINSGHNLWERNYNNWFCTTRNKLMTDPY